MANEDETRAAVRTLIGEMAPNGAREVSSSELLVEDLGYDSLAVIELSLQLESNLGLTAIGQDDAPDIKTVEDVETLVVHALAGAAAQAAGAA